MMNSGSGQSHEQCPDQGKAVEDPDCERLSLTEAVTHLLEECRMVLPGIQALFGFQLIAVFNEGFSNKLTPVEQRVHLVALALIAIAAAMVMTPAAFHRQTGPRQVSKKLVSISTRFLLWSMFPLMVGINLDFYLIAHLILGRQLLSIVLTLVLLSVFSMFWFLLPNVRSMQRFIRSRH